MAHILTPFLDRTGAYGMDQWAFRPKRSCRDLVALLVLRWIWALDHGFKVAIFLSDISGAFDNVDRDILVAYLRNARVLETLCDFIEDYLAPRSATAIVQGTYSTAFRIENQVFKLESRKLAQSELNLATRCSFVNTFPFENQCFKTQV